MSNWRTVLEDKRRLMCYTQEELVEARLEGAGWGFLGGVCFTIAFVIIAPALALHLFGG